jgi:hypothetical protein
MCDDAGTDILLGYHSEEGWTAAIHLITGHYGYETEVRNYSYNHTMLTALMLTVVHATSDRGDACADVHVLMFMLKGHHTGVTNTCWNRYIRLHRWEWAPKSRILRDSHMRVHR